MSDYRMIKVLASTVPGASWRMNHKGMDGLADLQRLRASICDDIINEDTSVFLKALWREIDVEWCWMFVSSAQLDSVREEKLSQLEWFPPPPDINWSDKTQRILHSALNKCAGALRMDLVEWLLDEWRAPYFPPRGYRTDGLSIADVVCSEDDDEARRSTLITDVEAQSAFNSTSILSNWDGSDPSVLLSTLEHFRNPNFDPKRSNLLEPEFRFLAHFDSQKLNAYEFRHKCDHMATQLIHSFKVSANDAQTRVIRALFDRVQTAGIPRLDLLVREKKTAIYRWLVSEGLLDLHAPLMEVLDDETAASSEQCKECCICSREFPQLVRLACSHELCRMCVRKIFQNEGWHTDGSARTCKCPFCRQDIPPPSIVAGDVAESLALFLPEVAKWLAEDSSGLNVGEVLCFLAASFGSLAILIWLIDEAGVSSELCVGGETMLHRAVAANRLITAKWLAARAPNLATTLSLKTGLSPVHVALRKSPDDAMVDFCFGLPSHPDRKGRDCLYQALRSKNEMTRNKAKKFKARKMFEDVAIVLASPDSDAIIAYFSEMESVWNEIEMDDVHRGIYLSPLHDDDARDFAVAFPKLVHALKQMLRRIAAHDDCIKVLRPLVTSPSFLSLEEKVRQVPSAMARMLRDNPYFALGLACQQDPQHAEEIKDGAFFGLRKIIADSDIIDDACQQLNELLDLAERAFKARYNGIEKSEELRALFNSPGNIAEVIELCRSHDAEIASFPSDFHKILSCTDGLLTNSDSLIYHGENALVYAASCGRADVVEYILTSVVTSDGVKSACAALLKATDCRCCFSVVQFLYNWMLSEGLDVNQFKSDKGESLLDSVCYSLISSDESDEERINERMNGSDYRGCKCTACQPVPFSTIWDTLRWLLAQPSTTVPKDFLIRHLCGGGIRYLRFYNSAAHKMRTIEKISELCRVFVVQGCDYQSSDFINALLRAGCTDSVRWLAEEKHLDIRFAPRFDIALDIRFAPRFDSGEIHEAFEKLKAEQQERVQLAEAILRGELPSDDVLANVHLPGLMDERGRPLLVVAKATRRAEVIHWLAEREAIERTDPDAAWAKRRVQKQRSHK
jgi:hypothetical protein